MLSFLSYNIHLGLNFDQIIVWLNTLPKQFDIICFQEFPLRKLNDLQYSLKPFNYEFQYATSFILKNEDYGQLTLIHKKKVQVLSSYILYLGTSFIEQKIIRLKGERSSLMTQLRYNNKTFLLANTHLVAYASNRLRRNHLSKLIEYINNSFNDENLSVIVLGDFNYSSFIRQEKLLNFMKGQGFTNGYIANTHKLLPLTYHQLDYLFYKNSRVHNVEVRQLAFSDHFPVIFKLQI